MSIDPSTLVLMIINFIVLMVLLNIFLYKPVLSFTKQRQQKIDEGLAAAKKAQDILEEKQQEIDKQRAEVKKQCAQKLEQVSRRLDEAKFENGKKCAELSEKMRREETARLYEHEEQLVCQVENNMDRFVSMVKDKAYSSVLADVGHIGQIEPKYLDLVKKALDSDKTGGGQEA